MIRFPGRSVVCFMALTFLNQMAHAEVDRSYLGRWRLVEVVGLPTFTMDIVPCGDHGDHLCAILVEAGRCGAVVLEPYVAPGRRESAEKPSGEGWMAEYRLKPPDWKAEFVVRFFGNSAGMYLEGRPISESEAGGIGRRVFALSLRFDRIGEAECSLPAPSS